MALRLFMGIDGGQSSTTVLVGDARGKIIGTARGGPCNHVASASLAEKFRSVVADCVSRACESAGLDSARACFEAVCCGMSGGPGDKETHLREIIRSNHILVTDDGVIALGGAMEGGPGIVVVSGTGSIAYGRNGSGRLMRAGGWGYIFGDEGGAFDIARQALRAVLRSEEGWGLPTSLRNSLLDEAGCSSANDLLHLLYTPEWPRSRIATFSALVDSVAEDGDPVARGILEHAAQSLAMLASAIRRELFGPGEPAEVAYVGGVFRSRLLLERFRMLIELEEGSRCVHPARGPAAGALLEAYRAANLVVKLSQAPGLKEPC